MLDLFLRRGQKTKLRCAVITPIGPGHAQAYDECRGSVNAAWRRNSGPFVVLDLIPVDDSAGILGRSLARNEGVRKAAAAGADWLFFLDADDLMLPDAFANVGDCIERYDALWGLIASRAFGTTEQHLRLPQILSIDRIESLLIFDPFLTLQMGHFVRTSAALATPFNEDLNAGEDFDYYLRLWERFRCAKLPRSFFVARQGCPSTGPRGASAQDWGTTVRSRLLRERERYGLDASSPQALVIKNAAVKELQVLYRERGLADVTNYVELSRALPYRGIHKIEIPGAEPFDMYSDNDDPACLSLAWTGEYRDAYTRLWQALSRPARVILDIGAGTGFFGLLAACTAGAKARIYCIEARAENYARLLKNIDSNALSNISASITAPERESTSKVINGLEVAGPLYLQSQSPDLRLHATEEKRAHLPKADDVAQECEDHVGLMRIALAVRELQVLSNVADFTASHCPDILLELLPNVRSEKIEELLGTRGYRRFILDEKAETLRPVTRISRTNEQRTPVFWLTTRSDADVHAVSEEAGVVLKLQQAFTRTADPGDPE